MVSYAWISVDCAEDANYQDKTNSSSNIGESASIYDDLTNSTQLNTVFGYI